MTPFLTSETGAVTVDWVVLTAGLVGLGLATLSVVSSGVEDVSGDVDKQLSGNHIFTRFGPVLNNGDLSDVTGMTPVVTGGGALRWHAGALPGWTDENGHSVALVADGYAGISGIDGNGMIDMDAGPGRNHALRQTVAEMIVGQTKQLTIQAADAAEVSASYGENSVEIWFGGEYVGLVDPSSNVMEGFTFDLVGGAGDGSDTLELREVGPSDQLGTYIGAISID